MNALRMLLAQYAGTSVLAPVAGGVKQLANFASNDCCVDCDEEGKPYVYCDAGGSDN